MAILFDAWGQILSLILKGYENVFPEYPQIGLWVCGLAVLLFFFYLIKSSLGQGAKIGGAALVCLTFVCYCLHAIHVLFFY